MNRAQRRAMGERGRGKVESVPRALVAPRGVSVGGSPEWDNFVEAWMGNRSPEWLESRYKTMKRASNTRRKVDPAAFRGDMLQFDEAVRESAREKGEDADRALANFALTNERKRASDMGPLYVAPAKNDWPSMLREEWEFFVERMIEEGLMPEPTINVERVLSRPLLALNRFIFRWRLSPFRLTPESHIAQLLNRLRPGMGYSVVVHDVQEHRRREHTRTYRAKDGSIKTTSVRASLVTAHARGGE